MDLKKEVIDQSAHFFVGLVATLVLAFYLQISVYLAASAVMIFAFCREIYQRLKKNDVWYSCGQGCKLDLIFWMLGVFAAIGAIYVVSLFV